ncbi:MAG: AAA family ATPase, partial [Patescibacteria group bacterium]
MNPQNFDIRKSRFYPILVMENIFSHKSRHKILNFLFILIILLAIVIIAGYASNYFSFLLPKIFGLIFIVSAIFLCTFSLEAFFRSFYFKKKISLIIQDPDNLADYFGFEACRLAYKSPNLVRSFMTSDIGRMAMVRSGINAESVTEFLKKFQNQSPISLMDILHESFILAQKNNHKIIFVEDLIVSLFKKEKIFSDFLFDFEIKEEELIGILEWVMRSFEKQKKKEAWWERENLGQISGLAKDWAYGETYTLEKYSHDLFYNAADAEPLRLIGKEEEIRKIEIILSRSKGANVLIVGDPGVGRKTVVLGFVKMIMTGKASPVLEYKRVVKLDTDAIIAATKQKGQLEELLIKIFNEAVSAGNIIIVFENFPAFLKSAENIGTNIASFLEPYFNSPNLQTIAVADMGEFHKIMEPDSALMKFFEKIEIEEPDEKNSITILETVAEEAERNSGIIFTYPVIKEIIRSSSLYLVEGAMPEKAIGLLSQMIPFIVGKQGVTIKKEDVLEFIRLKTKMPVGEIKPEEKEQLLNLEKFMHKRVVGQEEAITAISEAIRRARTEIRDTKKPIGSFLFLGPTGVGKTETAKALAQAFFKDEENIVRFDMSEYQADDALNRLIGSFAENKPGILASSLREKPYGLLLMDEFEKTNP